MNGIDATRAVVAAHPEVGVLVLTMGEDDGTVLSALRAGARGYLRKGAEQDEIVRAVSTVHGGGVVFGASLAARIAEVLAPASRPERPFPGLTERETEVLDLIAAGRSTARSPRLCSSRPNDPQQHHQHPGQAPGHRPGRRHHPGPGRRAGAGMRAGRSEGGRGEDGEASGALGSGHGAHRRGEEPGEAGRPDPFERFVELSTKVISRAPFFAVVVAVVVIWAASYPLWKTTTKWELAIHTFGAVLSLLLLVLLENAGRRNTEAMQEKLNVIAEALAALMDSRAADDPRLREAVEDLREAVGLEERH